MPRFGDVCAACNHQHQRHDKDLGCLGYAAVVASQQFCSCKVFIPFEADKRRDRDFERAKTWPPNAVDALKYLLGEVHKHEVVLSPDNLAMVHEIIHSGEDLVAQERLIPDVHKFGFLYLD